MNLEKIDIGKGIEKISKWNPIKEIPNDEFFYIDLSSVDKVEKKINKEFVQKLKGDEAPSRAKQIISKGDILVSTVRPNLNGVAIIENDYKNGTASTGYCVLRTNSLLFQKYLYYWVRTPFFIKDMTNKASGASYPAVSDKIIKESKIPLPPLAEQKKIAAILDEADRLRQLNQQVLDQYDALTQSLFLDMFGDTKFNPKKWVIHNLEKICTHIIDCPHSTPKYVEEITEFPCIRTTELKNGLINWKKMKYLNEEGYKKRIRRLELRGGDIIYGREGTFGEAAIVPHSVKMSLGQRVVLFRPDENFVISN